MLKTWNASLILGSGTFAILGTFLVRSGILDSIHAFGASTLGIPFVFLIATMVAGSIGLVVWRRSSLRSDAQLDSLLSREAVFLFQNLVLVAMVFVIFWVTFFPLISQALTGTKVSVGPPAFRPFIVPLALVLVLLSGIGPIIAWRRVTAANLRRNFTFPVLVGAGHPGGGAGRHQRRLTTVRAHHVHARRVRRCQVTQELRRGVGARRALTSDPVPIAFAQLIKRNRRRYGGYIVHAGLAVLLVGVAASSLIPALARCDAVAGSADRCRRVHVPLRPSDGQRDVGQDLLRRGARCLQTRPARRHRDHDAGLLSRTADPSVGSDLSGCFNGAADSQVGLRAG